MDESDLHAIDAQLRAIRVDDGPPRKPLLLDKMFMRAIQWSGSSKMYQSDESSTPPPPSPPRQPEIYPLPLGIPEQSYGPSPLSMLFRYEELVPLVLENFDKPSDWAKLCRVSKGWCRIGRKRLYEHVWVRPWEDGPHVKLVRLFETLHRRPELCRLIRRLDVRFFPLATRGEERSDLDDHVQLAMSNMCNLESLIWTRDKSLNPTLFETISHLPRVQSLEISGHSYRYYDPSLLGTFSSLKDLRIMMPDPHMKSKLVGLVTALDEREQGGLKGLDIICQSSSLIDDTILTVMAPRLRNLRRLTFWGCTRVARDGIYSILNEVGPNIQELSLDALPHSSLLDLTSSTPLPQLQTFSLSITIPHRESTSAVHTLSLFDLPALPVCPSLSALHLTISGSKPLLPLETWITFQSQLPENLRKLSLVNLVITSPETLSTVLESLPNLEELYITATHPSIMLPIPALSASSLRIFHVNFTLSSASISSRGAVAQYLHSLAEKMEQIEQIGSANMVFEVHRRMEDDGERIVKLCRWSRTFLPGYFQVWRA
ncbi:hypothetical protein I352_01999 [Cryptococcus deuterogattii MMRL2647]|nr:hypothetical protein I352_01999 [Cryptococcus deuterogattii MMRL2647]